MGERLLKSSSLFQYQFQGGYGGYPPAAPSSVSPETQRMFDMVDKDRSGKINAAELKAALINGKGDNFSDTACSLMIGMFDTDKSGTIDVMEFEKLFAYINQWLGVFKTYDRDQSGHIDEGELFQALSQMGFRFTPEFIKFLVGKCDPATHKEVSVDQFIVLCKFRCGFNSEMESTLFYFDRCANPEIHRCFSST